MIILLLALLTLAASIIGTMTGFGTSSIMIPVLVMFMSPGEAIFLVAIIHWFGNLWNVLLFKAGFNVRLFVLFGVSGFIASYAGAVLSFSVESGLLLRFLGIFLAGYSIALIVGTKVKVRAGTKTALAGGALSGFFMGMFGIGGFLRSAFLMAFDLPKAVYIATVGAIGLLVDSTRIAAYFFGGADMREPLWWGLLVFIPVSFAGANIAKKIVHVIPQDAFRRVLACCLLLLALKLVIQPR